MFRINEYGQPIGRVLSDWTVREEPGLVSFKLPGYACRLEPIDVTKHADDLYAACSQTNDKRDSTYLFQDPFENTERFREYIISRQSADRRTYAVINTNSGKAVGIIGLANFNTSHGAVEVGAIFSPLLKQSILSTVAQYLLMTYVFDQLGFRRYEWKCDSLNEASLRAALRLGFKCEGTFRNYQVIENRNIDLTHFSIIDEEWPKLKIAFQAWLAPENFDADGRQLKSLASFQEN